MVTVYRGHHLFACRDINLKAWRPWNPNTKSTGWPGKWTTAPPTDRPGRCTLCLSHLSHRGRQPSVSFCSQVIATQSSLVSKMSQGHCKNASFQKFVFWWIFEIQFSKNRAIVTLQVLSVKKLPVQSERMWCIALVDFIWNCPVVIFLFMRWKTTIVMTLKLDTGIMSTFW